MKPGLARAVLSDLRWSCTPPWNWLSGVAFNLGLSLAYLVIVPLTGRPHRDWAILVGTYFAVFILADVTTTNVLGADHLRVRRSLDRRTSLARILLIKNITLMLLVGVPTLIATAAITVHSESAYRLDLTLPGVLYPVLTWLGVGNLVSVALPVAARPLRERWHRRRELRSTVRWLVALGLPYALCVAVDPLSKVPRLFDRLLLGPLPLDDVVPRGVILVALGIILYAGFSVAALLLARVRAIRFDEMA